MLNGVLECIGHYMRKHHGPWNKTNIVPFQRSKLQNVHNQPHEPIPYPFQKRDMLWFETVLRVDDEPSKAEVLDGYWRNDDEGECQTTPEVIVKQDVLKT